MLIGLEGGPLKPSFGLSGAVPGGWSTLSPQHKRESPSFLRSSGAGPCFHHTQKWVPCPSRVVCERAGLLADRGGGPPDTSLAAHDDGLSNEIQFRPRLLPGSVVPGTAPRPILRTFFSFQVGKKIRAARHPLLTKSTRDCSSDPQLVLVSAVPSNVSGCAQTVKSVSDSVCAVPLWMLQVPRPEIQALHNARVFCVRTNSKIKSPVKPLTAARRES